MGRTEQNWVINRCRRKKKSWEDPNENVFVFSRFCLAHWWVLLSLVRPHPQFILHSSDKNQKRNIKTIEFTLNRRWKTDFPKRKIFALSHFLHQPSKWLTLMPVSLYHPPRKAHTASYPEKRKGKIKRTIFTKWKCNFDWINFHFNTFYCRVRVRRIFSGRVITL